MASLSIRIASANMPGFRAPISPSKPVARAPFTVPMRSTWAAESGRVVSRSNPAMRWILWIRRISMNGSSSSLMLLSSMPMATLTPALSIASTGAMPLRTWKLQLA